MKNQMTALSPDVIPAQARIHPSIPDMVVDPRLRGGDMCMVLGAGILFTASYRSNRLTTAGIIPRRCVA
jgi:hypothetical protein